MKRRHPRWTLALALLFALDRMVKYAAVIRFFRRPPPPPPERWPSLAVLQPITRDASGLAGNLRARLGARYPGAVEHFLICDRADHESRRICAAALAAHPAARATILLADAPGGVAGKVEKLGLALPLARGEMLWFLDDDVAPRPGAAETLVRHLGDSQAGSAFGLACYVNWDTVWSSAMSSFVNANVLISYIPLACLTEPYTITGHCFMLRRTVFEAIGGLAGMEGRVDDDHELARRVLAAGLRNVQTPLVYDVDNALGSWADYANQMRRWAVFPRATMLPQLGAYDQAVTALGSLGNLLPGLIALGALGGARRAGRDLALALGVAAAVYLHGERRYLKWRAPWRRLPVALLSILAAPAQVAGGLLGGGEIVWRGRRLRISPGQPAEVVG